MDNLVGRLVNLKNDLFCIYTLFCIYIYIYIYIYCIYKMYLISKEGYKNANTHCLEIIKTGKI